MLDVQRRRREEVEEEVEEVEEGGKRRKEEGTNRYWGEKTQRQKERTKPSGKTWQDFLLFFFSALSPLGVGMARRWVMRARRSEKPRQTLCFAGLALHVWLKRWNIPRFWGAFLPKLCGKQYNGDYKSLDLEKGCNRKKKKRKGGERRRFADSSWLYGNILRYYSCRMVQILCRAVTSGGFWSIYCESWALCAQTKNIWDNRYHWPNESPHVNQFLLRKTHSWNSSCGTILSRQERRQVWPDTKTRIKQWR